ncbi:hypothetical protein HPB51_008132 [Rhipicephalus microplus]|uniref:C2H2-type domain-containing protein n=1 Tax=Rhipicephalus microplus TaxID=6941 RepID=A0A9J6E888_RHIMP|nr:hypothetical protein HPB51_008132 [Rhipicephalus microplus]
MRKEPLCCNICPYATRYSTHFKDHMRVHSGEKPFKCTKCPNSFTQRAHLQRHLRTHEPLNPRELALARASFRKASSPFALEKVVHCYVVVMFAEEGAKGVQQIQNNPRVSFLCVRLFLVLGVVSFAHVFDKGLISHFLVHDYVGIGANERINGEFIWDVDGSKFFPGVGQGYRHCTAITLAVKCTFVQIFVW